MKSLFIKLGVVFLLAFSFTQAAYSYGPMPYETPDDPRACIGKYLSGTEEGIVNCGLSILGLGSYSDSLCQCIENSAGSAHKGVECLVDYCNNNPDDCEPDTPNLTSIQIGFECAIRIGSGALGDFYNEAYDQIYSGAKCGDIIENRDGHTLDRAVQICEHCCDNQTNLTGKINRDCRVGCHAAACDKLIKEAIAKGEPEWKPLGEYYCHSARMHNDNCGEYSHIPPSPSNCSLAGCSGFSKTLGCTHCKGANRCDDNSDCSPGYGCRKGCCWIRSRRMEIPVQNFQPVPQPTETPEMFMH